MTRRSPSTREAADDPAVPPPPQRFRGRPRPRADAHAPTGCSSPSSPTTRPGSPGTWTAARSAAATGRPSAPTGSCSEPCATRRRSRRVTCGPGRPRPSITKHNGVGSPAASRAASEQGRRSGWRALADGRRRERGRARRAHRLADHSGRAAHVRLPRARCPSPSGLRPHPPASPCLRGIRSRSSARRPTARGSSSTATSRRSVRGPTGAACRGRTTRGQRSRSTSASDPPRSRWRTTSSRSRPSRSTANPAGSSSSRSPSRAARRLPNPTEPPTSPPSSGESPGPDATRLDRDRRPACSVVGDVAYSDGWPLAGLLGEAGGRLDRPGPVHLVRRRARGHRRDERPPDVLLVLA